MHVRDAVEADAERLAVLTGAPQDVMRNLVHDRTVRVGLDGEAESDDPGDAEDSEDIEGFVSFDAQRDTVHVTQLEGPREACERLLEEPVRFARGESMAVELLVAEGDEETRQAAENVGFVEDGLGPRFGGTRTVRYRWSGD
ncbi:hypothetical protein [Halomarina litorea]|uniref:hypothetical protein n=1 Tax=Halomarina litorea TaxID=2961595 RepID=UPI0020C4265D|nr:hypothetical protein [Halomarina sp. BCD28]